MSENEYQRIEVITGPVRRRRARSAAGLAHCAALAGAGRPATRGASVVSFLQLAACFFACSAGLYAYFQAIPDMDAYALPPGPARSGR